MATISYEDFQKVEMKIGRIKKAEKVEGTDRLMKMEVDLGEETRTIVAGIAESYQPDDLLEQQVVVVVNLESREIKGVESQGMVLAADGGEVPILLCPEKKVSEGSIVK